MTEVIGLSAFAHSDLPTAEVDRQQEVYDALADAVRGLVDATIRSTVPEECIRSVEERVRALTEELRTEQLPGPFGIHYNDEGRSWNWGNAVVGRRNAIAPPLELLERPGGGLRAEVELGGSDGHRRVTMTGTLTGRYAAPTPLGPVVLEGWIAREEGRKVFVEATLGTPDRVTVEAHGVFIIPSWA